MREVDAAAALVRGEDRPKFVHDVISALELRCGLRALTNDEVSKAVSDVIGVTPIRDI